MKITYEDFEAEVLTKAKELYGKAVCRDTVADSYLSFVAGVETVEGAVEQVIIDSAFWDGEF
jgi:hypothetical protein